jgi:hypothetical protein
VRRSSSADRPDRAAPSSAEPARARVSTRAPSTPQPRTARSIDAARSPSERRSGRSVEPTRARGLSPRANMRAARQRHARGSARSSHGCARCRTPDRPTFDPTSYCDPARARRTACRGRTVCRRANATPSTGPSPDPRRRPRSVHPLGCRPPVTARMLRAPPPRAVDVVVAEVPRLTGLDPSPAAPTVDDAGRDERREHASPRLMPDAVTPPGRFRPNPAVDASTSRDPRRSAPSVVKLDDGEKFSDRGVLKPHGSKKRRSSTRLASQGGRRQESRG